MSRPDDPAEGHETIVFARTDDLLPVERLAVGLVGFTTLHSLALAAAARLRADGTRLELSGNRFLNMLTMTCDGRQVTFTRGFGLIEDDVIQVSGIAGTQKLSLASRAEAVDVATEAMERAIHFLVTGHDLDAI